MQQSPLGSRRLNFNQIIKARSQCPLLVIPVRDTGISFYFIMMS
ncbi:hypothetical protein [Wolbachia endosymbiont (group A) of Pogonocherus hispidulus]